MNATSTRDRILRGAGVALREHGLDACSVQAVLSASDVSRRTFYQYFKSKDDLLLALYSERLGGLVGRMRRAVDGETDGIGRIRAALTAYADFQIEGGALQRSLQALAVGEESLLAPMRERTLDQLVELLDTEVEKELGYGLDPLVFRNLLLGAEGLVLHAQASGGFGESEKERILAVLLPAYLNTLGGPIPLPRR
ncbi:MAG: TetR/AcrR family transcriptional regulator [Proteobacteria bacterium]|nr:TetR/AcrR family transcriptional regulator [Pseudomonadota bacterium]MCP4919090.1 TetR/AcrR family transcriptional regulator [Pseudomonadota bacterium]